MYVHIYTPDRDNSRDGEGYNSDAMRKENKEKENKNNT